MCHSALIFPSVVSRSRQLGVLGVLVVLGTGGCGASSSGETTAAAEASQGGESETTAGETTASDIPPPECEALLACTGVVNPAGYTGVLAAYGPDGACYAEAGLTVDECAKQCDSARAALAKLNEDVAECAPLGCNDGKLDLDEPCDGTPGCTAVCTLSDAAHQCNLLNQTGCADGLLCWFTSTLDGFHCIDYAPLGAAIGDSCAPTLEPCSTEAACSDQPICGGSMCCVELCYLAPTADGFGDCTAGTCTSLAEVYPSNWPAGAELYGLCI